MENNNWNYELFNHVSVRFKNAFPVSAFLLYLAIIILSANAKINEKPSIIVEKGSFSVVGSMKSNPGAVHAITRVLHLEIDKELKSI